MRKVIFRDLGEIEYQKAWDYQTELFKSVIARKVENRKLEEADQKEQESYLLFCEHPHVYTLGRNGKEEHLLLDEAGLNDKNASFVKINRGGDITYHGYGQIVGYPILDLDEFFTDIGRYIRFLEEMVIRTLAEYGIIAGRIKGESGVWLAEGTPAARKICAVGVHLSRWVTMHGFAFNINTNMEYFNNIIPCGIQDKGVTSLAQELGRQVDAEEVKEHLLKHFTTLFEAELEREKAG
jgi:lipoyl(octanoyl) transferase